MNILTSIRSWFRKAGEHTQQAVSQPVYNYDITKDIKLVREHFKGKAEEVAGRFGGDFNAFLYRKDIANILRNEVVAFIDPEYVRRDYLDFNHWQNRNPLNFPGPFYVGESDTCGTGPAAGPANITTDHWAMEYILRQPADYIELLAVMEAAAIEVFDSYACNGNEYWTYGLCREWWRARDCTLAGAEGIHGGCAKEERLYLEYLNGAAETDLRKYCYFLEHGYYPAGDHVHLPDL